MLSLALASLTLSLPPPRAVVSFELGGVLWDPSMVRSAVRAELQPWLRTRSRVDRLSHYEPLDAYEQFETYCSEGAEFGMMNPGIQAVQREAVRASVAESGMDDDALDEAADEGVGVWTSAHDAYAEMLLDSAAVPALERLRDAGVVCCAVTSGLGDSARTPSLAPLLAFTLSTYEFTIGASEAWWTALQVAPMKFNPPAFGLPQIHVGGAAEGGLAALGSEKSTLQTVKTIAVGADAADAPATARVGSLAELPDAVEALLRSSQRVRFFGARRMHLTIQEAQFRPGSRPSRKLGNNLRPRPSSRSWLARSPLALAGPRIRTDVFAPAPPRRHAGAARAARPALDAPSPGGGRAARSPRLRCCGQLSPTRSRAARSGS